MPTGDVVLSYDLPVSAAQAFLLYVDRFGQWWPAAYTADPATYDTVVIEPVVGGRVLAHYTTGREEEWGLVTEIEPGVGLSHTFRLAARSSVPSQITVGFADTDTGSRMTFRHGGWVAANAGDRSRYGHWPLILSQFIALARARAAGRHG